MRLIKDLEPREAFLYVPNKCIISTEHARKSPLGPLFSVHPSLFVTNIDRDTVILMVYLIYERLKGTESFYRPYFDMVDSPLPTCYWSPEVLSRSDLSEFKADLEEARVRCDEEWASLSHFFNLYPDHFGEEVGKEIYQWALGFV